MRSFIPRGISPCLYAVMIDAMGFGLVYPMMTAILTSTAHPLIPVDASLVLRHFFLGLGFLLYPLGMFFGASFLGDLSDMWGRKKVLLFCMGGIFLSFLLMAVGTDFLSLWVLMLGRLLSGLMAGSQPIAQAAIADLSTQKTKALNMTSMTLALSVGNALGPFLGGFFSDSNLLPLFTFATPFYFSALLALSAVVWIAGAFEETFTQTRSKTIHFMRPIHIFIEAFQHQSVRFLSIIFLIMQVGFSLYFQLMPVWLHTRWNYVSWQLGTFNGLIGVSFALGLLLVMRMALKFWDIEHITVATLFLTGISQMISALIPIELFQWILAVPVALFDCLAYTGMLTCFSKAVSAQLQGWAMGISGSVMALAWVLAGLSTNLIATLGLPCLILTGGILIILSGVLMCFVKTQKGAK